MHISYDKTSTLRAETKHHEPVVLVYESHGQDCRYKPLGDVCSTVSQKYGTGGGDTMPKVIVFRDDITIKDELSKSGRPSKPRSASRELQRAGRI